MKLWRNEKLKIKQTFSQISISILKKLLTHRKMCCLTPAIYLCQKISCPGRRRTISRQIIFHCIYDFCHRQQVRVGNIIGKRLFVLPEEDKGAAACVLRSRQLLRRCDTTHTSLGFIVIKIIYTIFEKLLMKEQSDLLVTPLILYADPPLLLDLSIFFSKHYSCAECNLLVTILYLFLICFTFK